MLVGEGKMLDLQKIGVPQQAIEINTQRMSRQRESRLHKLLDIL